MKPESAGGRDPWHVRVEDQLRDRPGVLWIYLLTDEAGAAWIARGQVPEYMKRQALDALAWSGTLERMRYPIVGLHGWALWIPLVTHGTMTEAWALCVFGAGVPVAMWTEDLCR
jgi:hypothetical protein